MIKIPPVVTSTIFLITSGLLTLTSCQSAVTPTVPVIGDLNIQLTKSPESGIPTLEPYNFQTSKPGSTTLHGLLVVRDPTAILPGPDDAIFLVPMDSEGEGVTGIPQFTVGEVPQADVDERTGEFVFVDIQPGRYAVVVLTPGQSQIPTRNMRDGQYVIITISNSDQDKTIELGNLSLP